MRWRRWFWPGLLALVGLALALVPLAQGRFFFYWDNSSQHFPAVSFLSQSLRRGELPLWWPQVMAGFPLAAEGQAAHFHPVHVVLAWLFPPPTAFMLEIGAAFAVSSLGVYAFLRLFRLDPAVCASCAVMHAFSSMALVLVRNAANVRSACLFGFAMYFAERYARRPGPRDGAGLALVLGLQLLGGYPTPSLIAAGAVTFYVIVRVLQLRVRRQTRVTAAVLAGKAAAGILAFVILGGGIAAIQLVPTAQHVPESIRAAGFDSTMRSSGSSNPRHWLQWTMPYAVHPMRAATNRDEASGRGTSWFYMGALAPLLVIAAFWWRRRWSHPVWPLGAGVVASVLLAVGSRTPILPALLTLPVLNSFRYPSRILLWTSFCCAALAAFGLQHLLDRSRRRQRIPWMLVGTWMALVVASAAAAVVAGAGMTAIGLSLILTAVSIGGACVLMQSRGRRRSFVLVALAAFIVVDLGAFRVITKTPRTVPIAVSLEPPPLIVWMQKESGPFRVVALRTPPPARRVIEFRHPGFLTTPASTLYKLEGFRPNFSLPPSRSLLLDEVLEQWLTNHPDQLDRLSPLLAALNVKYLIGFSEHPVTGWPLAASADGLSAWQNPVFLPRAFLVGHAVAPPPLDGDTRAIVTPAARTALNYLKDPGFFLDDMSIVERYLRSPVDLATTAIVEGLDVPALRGLGAVHTVVPLERPAGTLAYRVESDRPALLYISAMHTAGWTATVNGTASRIYRTNWIGTAVEVPAGKSSVELQYKLPGLRTGSIVSVLCVVVAAVLTAGFGMRSRAGGHRSPPSVRT